MKRKELMKANNTMKDASVTLRINAMATKTDTAIERRYLKLREEYYSCDMRCFIESPVGNHSDDRNRYVLES